MAFYDDKEDENQQDPNANGAGQQTSTGSQVLDSGAGGASANAAAPKQAAAPDKSGNFVGIKQYLDANKTQAGKLGDQTAGVINTSADAARSGISALGQEAQEKIKPVSSLDQQTADTLKNGAENLSDDQRNTIKQTQAARYTGPNSYNSLNSYQSAADANSKAQTNIDNSGTEQGRMQLVSQINSAPRTQGENVFDNALLQAGGGREKVQQAAQANAGLKGSLDATTGAITNQIGRVDDPSTPDVDESSGAMGQTAKAQADAAKQVQDALAAWRSGFDPKVDAARNALTSQENAVQQDLGDNPLSLDQNTLALFGLNAGQRMYGGLNLQDYVKSPDVNSINAGNVASAQDYARYAALQGLSGDTSNVLDQANVGQAGTAPTFRVDNDKFRSDLQTKQDAFNQGFSAQPAINTIGTLRTAAGDPVSAFVNESGALKGKTLAQLEPLLNSWLRSDSSTAQYTAQQLLPVINKWKADQGYNNVISQNK